MYANHEIARVFGVFQMLESFESDEIMKNASSVVSLIQSLQAEWNKFDNE